MKIEDFKKKAELIRDIKKLAEQHIDIMEEITENKNQKNNEYKRKTIEECNSLFRKYDIQPKSNENRVTVEYEGSTIDINFNIDETGFLSCSVKVSFLSEIETVRIRPTEAYVMIFLQYVKMITKENKEEQTNEYIENLTLEDNSLSLVELENIKESLIGRINTCKEILNEFNDKEYKYICCDQYSQSIELDNFEEVFESYIG